MSESAAMSQPTLRPSLALKILMLILIMLFVLMMPTIKLRRYMTGEWQKAWSANPTGEFCRNIQPIVSGNIQYISKTREKEVIITRLRLGHCHLNYYLYKIDCHDTGLCDSCHVPQTLEHHFLFCDAQIYLITKLKQAALSLNKPFNICTVY